MEKYFRTKIRNNLLSLQHLVDELACYLDRKSVSADSSRKVRLVVEELVSNTIKYGYNSENTENFIDIFIFLNKKSIKLQIIDEANPFDPTAHRQNNIAQTLEKIKVGGLGLIIVKKICYRIKYERQGQKNYLSCLIPMELK